MLSGEREDHKHNGKIGQGGRGSNKERRVMRRRERERERKTQIEVGTNLQWLIAITLWFITIFWWLMAKCYCGVRCRSHLNLSSLHGKY